MKSSPSSVVGSMWSGSPERSRTLNRKSSGQRTKTASILCRTRDSMVLMTPSPLFLLVPLWELYFAHGARQRLSSANDDLFRIGRVRRDGVASPRAGIGGGLP